MGADWPFGTDPLTFQEHSERNRAAVWGVVDALSAKVERLRLPADLHRVQLYDIEGSEPGFFGFDLYSGYNHEGIPEGRKAAILGGVAGFQITPALLARADALRDELVAVLPAFAGATLAVFTVHW